VKEESVDSANFTLVLFEEISTATATFSNHQPDQSAAINTEAKRLRLAETSDDG
jgi:hypothetical protein